MKILLHCCCAPCAAGSLRLLQDQNYGVDLLWYNPNIHPHTEYTARKNCFENFVKDENYKARVFDEYNEEYLNQQPPGMDKSQRCTKCYTIRMEKTAEAAKNLGVEGFSTSLLISHYQDHEKIKEICKAASKKYDTKFFYMDFRPGFRAGQEYGRKKGFYMQKYCGCTYSSKKDI